MLSRGRFPQLSVHCPSFRNYSVCRKDLLSHIIGHVFQLTYAVYCDKLIQGEKINPHQGYTIQNPSQRQHPCLMMDIEYTWVYYHEACEQTDLAMVLKTVESICSTLGLKLGQIWESYLTAVQVALDQFISHFVNTGSLFLVCRLQKSTLEVAKISVMVAAKLQSPLVYCPQCPEGNHPRATSCFSPQIADTTTLPIMIQLLEGRLMDPTCFAFIDVCTGAQYLLIAEDYLTPYLLGFLTDKGTCTSPNNLKGIELLYVAGYHSLAKYLYIFACSRLSPQIMQKAYELIPDLFQGTDFFWD